MITREAVIEEAKTWLGTPYHHMGTVKGVGVDCGQILIKVYSEVGLVPEFDPGYYPSDWHFHRSDEVYLEWLEKFTTSTDKPKPGDIALFKFGRCASHGAIVVDNETLIHSYNRLGVVYAKYTDAELAGRLVGHYTFWSDK